VETTIYALAGLRIVSEFPLVGLQICHNEAAAHGEVIIRRAPIPAELASATATLRAGRLIGRYDGRSVLLDSPSVGRFLLRDGKEILMDPTPSCPEDEVRAYLLSVAFGALCHQRGIIPLHASAIDVADSCIAFVGESGAGKSTLAAALARRGHEVIADDVCFLRLEDKHNVQAWPGIERIRLWEEAVYALGCDGPGVEREMHGYNKYFVPVRPPRNPRECRPLRRIYELHTSPNGANEVTRFRGAAAVEILIQNVYRPNLAERLGYKPHVFKVCAVAARRVPVFRLSRPMGFDALERGVEFLEDHLLDMG
jgi:hypothetical protein